MRRDTAAVARAYQRTFKGNPDGDVILADLHRFCRVSKGGLEVARDGHVDPYATMYANGLKAAYERIVAFIEYQPKKETSDVPSEPTSDADGAG